VKARAAIVAALFTASVVAAEPDRGFYVGADAAEIDASAGRSHGILVGTPEFIVRVRPDSANVGNTGVSWGAQIGYRINRFLAAELAYADYGSMLVSETYDLSSILGSPVILERDVHYGVSGPSLSWLGLIPLGARLEAIVRVGVLHADQEIDWRNRAVLPGQSTLEKVSSFIPILGIGAAYRVSEDWSVRIEYQEVDGLHGDDSLDGTDTLGPIRIRRYGAGVVYRF
jgi:hypothetical protein